MILKNLYILILFVLSAIVIMTVTSVIAKWCGWPGCHFEWMKWLFLSIPGRPDFSLPAANLYICELQRMGLLWLVWLSDLLIMVGSMISVVYLSKKLFFSDDKNVNREENSKKIKSKNEKLSSEVKMLMELFETKIDGILNSLNLNIEQNIFRLEKGLIDTQNSLEEAIQVLNSRESVEMCGYCGEREQIKQDWEVMLRESEEDPFDMICNRSAHANRGEIQALSAISKAFWSEDEREC